MHLKTYLIKKKVKARSLKEALKDEKGEILMAGIEKEMTGELSDAIGFTMYQDEANEQ